MIELSLTFADLEPVVSDLGRAKEFGPVEFDEQTGFVVERINLDLADAQQWNASQAQEVGDEWWLARYGVTLAEIRAAGEAGFEMGGCEEDYWSAVPSVWAVRNELRPFVDAYPQTLKEQSFQECRDEFGFTAVDLGELEGSTTENMFLEECLRRWDEAGQTARRTEEQDGVVAELEIRFADEIGEQRAMLDRAMADEIFIALFKAS